MVKNKINEVDNSAPSVRDLEKIFAMYWRCEAVRKTTKIIDYGTIPINVNFFQRVHHHGGGEYIGDYSIVLKPLEKISEDDAKRTAMIYYEDENTTYNLGKNLIRDITTRFDLQLVYNPKNLLNVFDFLRSEGYALPYKNWSVGELVKFGIYSLIE